jgi:hypothetical protein
MSTAVRASVAVCVSFTVRLLFLFLGGLKVPSIESER